MIMNSIMNIIEPPAGGGGAGLALMLKGREEVV